MICTPIRFERHERCGWSTPPSRLPYGSEASALTGASSTQKTFGVQNMMGLIVQIDKMKLFMTSHLFTFFCQRFSGKDKSVN